MQTKMKLKNKTEKKCPVSIIALSAFLFNLTLFWMLDYNNCVIIMHEVTVSEYI